MPLLRHARRAALACALAFVGWPALAEPPDTIGLVSFYGPESGHRTANSEHFRPDHSPDREGVAGTCAHWRLPFGTLVRVEDLDTGRAILCRVNDRGPHPRLHRALDLNRGAARALGILRRGVITARLTVEPAP